MPIPSPFETLYIFTAPSYSAEYEPAQGLFLALGQKLFGHPWAGVLISMGLFCAACYWAFLAWLSPPWAFAGTLLVVVQIGVLSYWTNSFWGGCVPGIGGTLALGGLARLRGNAQRSHAFLLALGILILIGSRPLEGALLCVIVVGFFAFWLLMKRIPVTVFLKQVTLPVILIFLPAAFFLAYYNQRITGKPTTVPYLLYRAKYSIPQGFYWQKPVLAKAPMPVDIQTEYKAQLEQRAHANSVRGLITATLGKLRRFWTFYVDILLSVVLVAAPFIWRDRNMDIVFLSLFVVLLLDNLTFFAYFPHYSAPVAAMIFLVLFQCLRALRHWGQSGLFLSRSIPLACCLALLIVMSGRVTQPFLPASASKISSLWDSQYERWISRERFVPRLDAVAGKQLVLIRYNAATHQNDNAWTFNLANLNNAKIVWARESSDPTENRRIMEYFAGRKVWLAEPDANPQRIIPYPGLTP